MNFSYPCELVADEDGHLAASFPDVPEAITGGADRVEAMEMAGDALAVALAGYVHQKRDIPAPRAAEAGQELVAVPAVVAAKLALYSAMRVQRITKAELDHHSQIGQVQKALQAVGHNPAIEVTPGR